MVHDSVHIEADAKCQTLVQRKRQKNCGILCIQYGMAEPSFFVCLFFFNFLFGCPVAYGMPGARHQIGATVVTYAAAAATLGP